VTEERSPAERLLEVLVFAPAGLAITAAEEFPRLVEKGKHRIEGQLHAARLVGQFAVQMGRSQIDKTIHRVSTPSPSAPPARYPGEEATGSGPPPSGGGGDLADTPDRAPVDTVYGDTAAEAANGTHAPAALAIPGYDTLSAPQVVQRLGGLSAVELEEVRAHELTHRHRRTILNRVDQLLGAADAIPPG
jgi:hypothetical protein